MDRVVPNTSGRSRGPRTHQPRHGWQQKATRQLEEGFSTPVVWPRLNDSRRALSWSQHGLCRTHPHSQLREQRGLTPSHSGCSCVEGCTCLFPCLIAPADVAANMTCLATIAQRAQRQGCWGRGGSLWSAPPRKSAGRQVFGWPRMCFCATWTWRRSTLSMVGGLRSLRTGSHCGEERSWQWTPQWCPPCGETGLPNPGPPTTMAPPWRQHGARRKPPTLSLRERVAAPDWWFSPLRWEADGMLRRAQFLTALARAGAQELPLVLRWAEAVWVRRWSAILACTAARAFTVSLLDSRPAVGTGSQSLLSKRS